MSAAWKQSPNAAIYLPTLAAAELAHGIQTDLLARIAYQESRWRTDIVCGYEKSPAGCVGLMQLNPKFFPGAGADWHTDVIVAAGYLAKLYVQFRSDWQMAVAAYNWGPGNLSHWTPGAALPKETADYVAQVAADVPIAGQIMASPILNA